MNTLFHYAVILPISIFLYAIPCNSTTIYNTNSTTNDNTSENISLQLFTSNGPTYFLVVDKNLQQLSLFQHDQNLKLVKVFTSATGENPGTKVFSGDSRTPEGVYFITEVYEDKKITVFGSRAFHLDYPNIFDKHSGHQGDGIFIHGTNKKLVPYTTNGCITLDNKDLDELAPYLAINSIPVIIVDNIEKSVANNTLSLKTTDTEFSQLLDLLNLQSPDFSRENISTLSLIRVGSQAIASITYKIFNENSMEYLYKKRVYLTPSSENSWRSLHGIHYQEIIPKILAVYPIKNKLIAQLETPQQETKQIFTGLERGSELLQFVEKWRSAWSSKDIETYMSCYSPTFKNGKLNFSGWKNRKTYLNNIYEFIQVNIENIVVEWTEVGANVSFFQSYRSDKFHTSGKKLLKLVYHDNGWLIQKEIM